MVDRLIGLSVDGFRRSLESVFPPINQSTGQLMNSLLRRLCSGVVICGPKVFQFVRAVSGDDAYERYLERKQAEGARDLLSPREFYRQSLEHRYNSKTPSRCC